LGYRPDSFPRAEALYEGLLSLPLYPRMTEDDVADVVDTVTEICLRFRARR
jgi:dTDP-4-amino-4,6-dideoxygalactose transaminase